MFMLTSENLKQTSNFVNKVQDLKLMFYKHYLIDVFFNYIIIIIKFNYKTHPR